MAAKTGVPIVPITLAHTHAVMPGNALFPVQSGAGKLHVHVHDEIDTTGKSEDELVELVRGAFLSTLPLEQQPLESETSNTDDSQALSDENEAAQPSSLKNETAIAV